MLSRALAGRIGRSRLRPPPLAFPSTGCASRATSSAADVVFDDTPPKPSSPSPSPSAAAAVAAADPTVLQPRVLIYDGVCHLCHRGVKWVIKADKHAKIKFCCVQSRAAETYLRLVGVDREDVLRRFLFIEGPEAYYEGSTAAAKVASYLPFPYSALSYSLIVPVPVRDAVYDYIAKHRYDWFGREEKCLVMKDKELLERFIDRDEMLGNGDTLF